jgi:hypothetical protein
MYKRTPEERAGCNAKQRCTNPKDSRWESYGGRGIEFRFASVAEFVKYVGPRPTPEHMMDRVDNDGHYEKGNLRWSTPTISVVNRRLQSNNTSGYRGVSLDGKTWAAYAHVAGKRKLLGLFSTARLAAQAYDIAAKKLYGEEAHLNF